MVMQPKNAKIYVYLRIGEGFLAPLKEGPYRGGTSKGTLYSPLPPLPICRLNQKGVPGLDDASSWAMNQHTAWGRFYSCMSTLELYRGCREAGVCWREDENR
jgi:hypothetical protein